ncbi:hypothetical protein PFISCL1PPCAC_11460, partial [Pristionchus fissidentatus]
ILDSKHDNTRSLDTIDVSYCSEDDILALIFVHFVCQSDFSTTRITFEYSIFFNYSIQNESPSFGGIGMELVDNHSCRRRLQYALSH